MANTNTLWPAQNSKYKSKLARKKALKRNRKKTNTLHGMAIDVVLSGAL